METTDNFDIKDNFYFKKMRKDYLSSIGIDILDFFDSNEIDTKIIEKSLTAKQKEAYDLFLSNKFNFFINHGAVRSGKTIISIFFFLRHVTEKMEKGERGIMTGFSLTSLRRNVIVDLIEMCEKMKISVHPKSGEFLKDSSLIIDNKKVFCLGTDTVRSRRRIRGLTASAWYANEVVEQHEEAIPILFSRLSGKNRFIVWDCNPTSPSHFIKENYIDNTKNKKMCAVHWRLEDNTYLTEEFIQSFKATIFNKTIYQRDVEGLWTLSADSPFTDLRFTNDDFPTSIENFAWLDVSFGGEDQTALTIASAKNGMIYVLGFAFEEHVKYLYDKIIFLLEKYNVSQIGYEDNNDKGRGVQQELMDRNSELGVIAIHQTEQKTSKINSRISFFGNKLIFCQSQEFLESQKNFRKGIREYPYYKSDDSPDSLASLLAMWGQTIIYS